LQDLARVLAVAAEGDRIVGEAGHLEIYDITSGKKLTAIPGTSAAISGNGRVLVVPGAERDSFLAWDLDARAVRAVLRFPGGVDGNANYRLSRDGRDVVFAEPAGWVTVFRLHGPPKKP